MRTSEAARTRTSSAALAPRPVWNAASTKAIFTEYGVGVTKLLPTELLAADIFSENKDVGWYSNTNHLPGPLTPATGSREASAADRSGSSSSRFAVLLLAMLNLIGECL
jgi:hypothetical protein